jgi:hypothetical protein
MQKGGDFVAGRDNGQINWKEALCPLGAVNDSEGNWFSVLPQSV